MQQDDTVNNEPTNECPHKVTVTNDAFAYAFALYSSRVQEYFHSLFMGDYPNEQKNDNDDTQ